MRCTRPRTVGFKPDGKTIAWSQKERSKEFASFQLPCGKCIECRLDYGRQWATRCVHEASMHPENSFITLTYSDEKLTSPWLQYEDFQLFMKRLRFQIQKKIGFIAVGEYGEETKRPHWHAIIFNWYPDDATYFRSNDRGDRIYKSQSLEDLWSHGHAEVGSVTFHSAGYCARYAAKKLVHGKDDEHPYKPIFKTSNQNAIGKKFLERHWRDIFNYGEVVLLHEDGTSSKSSIPRYYEKWFKEQMPNEWLRYVTRVKLNKMALAEQKQKKIFSDYFKQMDGRPLWRPNPLPPNKIREIIMQQKFKQLQDNLKL